MKKNGGHGGQIPKVAQKVVRTLSTLKGGGLASTLSSKPQLGQARQKADEIAPLWRQRSRILSSGASCPPCGFATVRPPNFVSTAQSDSLPFLIDL